MILPDRRTVGPEQKKATRDGGLEETESVDA